MDQDLALEMLPASPYMRQQRSRRRRPEADSMPHYLSYTHSERSRQSTLHVSLLHLCSAPPLPILLPFRGSSYCCMQSVPGKAGRMYWVCSDQGQEGACQGMSQLTRLRWCR